MGESRAFERLVRKLTVEVLWLYVARVILSSGPLRAYDVKKRISESFGIEPRTMTTYTVVYRMVREGLLRPVRVDGDVLYELTERGRAEFERALEFLKSVVSYLSSDGGIPQDRG